MVFAQVKIDKINKPAENGLFLGVTRLPPEQRIVPMLSDDLTESIIIWESGVHRNKINVSFHCCEQILWTGVTVTSKEKINPLLVL